MNKIIKVFFREKMVLDVVYHNGSIKRFDVETLLDRYPVYQALKDHNLFLKGKIFGWSGIYWSKEIDLDGDTIYENGVDIKLDVPVQKYIIGYDFKELRLRRFLSQQQVSDETGIDQGDLSKIELGTGNPTLKTLERLANYYGKTVKIQLK